MVSRLGSVGTDLDSIASFDAEAIRFDLVVLTDKGGKLSLMALRSDKESVLKQVIGARTLSRISDQALQNDVFELVRPAV